MTVVSVRLIFDLLFQGDKKERMFFKRPFYASELFLPLIWYSLEHGTMIFSNYRQNLWKKKTSNMF